MEVFCNSLNDRAIKPGELDTIMHMNPKFIVLRNRVRMLLNQRMVIKRANHLGMRIIAWRAHDTLTDNSPLSREQELILTDLPPEATKKIGPMCMFFEGIEYLFGDSTAQDMGRYVNGTCVGKGVALHPDEPPDPKTGPVWMLQYQPLAVYVQPEVDVGDYGQGMAGIPRGCIPVTPLTINTAPTHVPKQALEFTLTDGNKVPAFYIKRTGIPLSFAYAATDYFMQGASVGEAAWLLHLRPPDVGRLSRACILVCLTRFSDASAIRLACPLWDKDARPDQIQAVVRKFVQAAKATPSLDAEMFRLKAAARDTQARLITEGLHVTVANAFRSAHARRLANTSPLEAISDTCVSTTDDDTEDTHTG